MSQGNIQEAEKYLATFKDKHWGRATRGEELQYYFGQADLHYRKQQYPKAREYAEKALTMAESFGFNTEIKLAKERLGDIGFAFDQCQRSTESRDNLDDNMADVSESTDSDWFIKPSYI